MAKSKKMTYKEFKQILKEGDNAGLIWIYSDEEGNPDFEAILNALAGYSGLLAKEAFKVGCYSSGTADKMTRDYIHGVLEKRGYYND